MADEYEKLIRQLQNDQRQAQLAAGEQLRLRQLNHARRASEEQASQEQADAKARELSEKAKKLAKQLELKQILVSTQKHFWQGQGSIEEDYKEYASTYGSSGEYQISLTYPTFIKRSWRTLVSGYAGDPEINSSAYETARGINHIQINHHIALWIHCSEKNGNRLVLLGPNGEYFPDKKIHDEFSINNYSENQHPLYVVDLTDLESPEFKRSFEELQRNLINIAEKSSPVKLNLPSYYLSPTQEGLSQQSPKKRPFWRRLFG